ncbi:CWF19-like protein 2 [Ananas comosus]|uniref:CWF19-like protein 2 n=1 Tax=Ananas comosus TaxID=4615 RepID=A0A199VVD5_ANACO|nr:CWF19-like protein 2 [Ananas comosus]
MGRIRFHRFATSTTPSTARPTNRLANRDRILLVVVLLHRAASSPPRSNHPSRSPKMLSGIKFIPGDQLLPAGKGSDSEESGEEKKDSRRIMAKDGDGKGKDEKKTKTRKKKKKSRRRSKRYSSDESESSSGSDEERRSKRSRRGGKKESFSDDSDSSEEYEDRKGGRSKRGKDIRVRSGKGKHSSHDEFSDDEELLNKSGNELARKEMGLEWMLKSTSRNESSCAQREEEPEQPEKPIEEIKQTNPKELNPYLKDNGSGYPDEKALSEAGDQLLSSSVVGDGGASWRLKALKRAKEQAAREGRKLDDVVEGRWGSLGQLAASVAASRAAPTHAHLHAIRNRKRGQTEKSEAVPPGELNEGRDYLRGVSSRNPEMRKPRQDNFPWKRNKGQNVSSEDKSLTSAALSGLNKFANDGSFMDAISHFQSKDASASNSSCASLEANEVKESDLNSLKDKSSNKTSSGNMKGLSANQFAAKILQLRMKGKHEEADKLSKEMEDMVEKQDSGSLSLENIGSSSRQSGAQISGSHKKREDDADLHLAKKIMQNRQFSLSGRADDEYDFDGVAPSRKSKKRKEAAPEENRFVRKQFSTQKERCQFCFENPSRPKHLVVSIANFTYLMLPQWHPVVEGHCIILPLQHEAATRTVDQNVWDEIRNFKKCLLKMFSKQDKDVVFLETVIGLAKQRRHCLIECIPIPYQLSRQAPMYFKKAIDEAEDEWGQHEMKKLIPTSGNLRQVIPANFSYFHVEFGLDRGFVHVIDDEGNFSSGFGLNVIRGLLRLPEEDMYRRRRLEPVEKQKLAVTAFMKEWEPFDWTKELD